MKRLTFPALATGVALLLNGCGSIATTTTSGAATNLAVAANTAVTTTVPAAALVFTSALGASATAVAPPAISTAAVAASRSTAALSTAAPAAATVTTNSGRPTLTASATSVVAAPATTTRSASVAATTAAAGGGLAAFEGDYQKMQQAMQAATSWRQTMVVTDKAGARTVMTIEFVRPDRMHEKTTDHAGVTTEYSIIGADMYRYDGTAWQKVPGGQVGQAMLAGLAGAKPGTSEYDQAQQARKDEGLTFAKGGRSTRNGVPCQEWNTTSTTPPTSGVLCIGLRNNLPVESKSSVEDGSTATVTYTDWNTPITINAPI